ncbi:MAG: hypothetical protein KBT03_07570 [Bacteroidales bacterium]|nr:hypothetical protein [Candidatus Scybalousia scybalohippi]
MNNKSKFVLNKKGVRQLLRSEELGEVLKTYANNGINTVASAKDYQISEYRGKNRTNVSISARTERGKKENLNNNILLKALGSSKG